MVNKERKKEECSSLIIIIKYFFLIIKYFFCLFLFVFVFGVVVVGRLSKNELQGLKYNLTLTNRLLPNG